MRKKQRDGLKKKSWQVIRALFDRARWGSTAACGLCRAKKLFLRRSCGLSQTGENDGGRSFRPGALGASQIVSFASETVCAYARHTLFRHVLTAAAGWRAPRRPAKRPARGARARSESRPPAGRRRWLGSSRVGNLEGRGARAAGGDGRRARACGGARFPRRPRAAVTAARVSSPVFRGRSAARSSPLSRRLGRRARRSSPSASRHVFRLRAELPRDAPGGGRLRAAPRGGGRGRCARFTRARRSSRRARSAPRGAAARGGARRLPRRGEGEPHRGERRGPSERRRPDPLRLRGRRHPLQRAPPRLGRRRRRARALGRAGRRPRGGGERGGGRHGRPSAVACARRRNRPKAPRGRPPGPPRAPRGSSDRGAAKKAAGADAGDARRPRAGGACSNCGCTSHATPLMRRAPAASGRSATRAASGSRGEAPCAPWRVGPSPGA